MNRHQLPPGIQLSERTQSFIHRLLADHANRFGLGWGEPVGDGMIYFDEDSLERLVSLAHQEGLSDGEKSGAQFDSLAAKELQGILEPQISATFLKPMAEADTVQLSIAISLKRIADALTESDRYGQTGSAAISSAIRDGIREARP